MTTRPVAVRVSQATRLVVSSVRQASRMASEIWSAILSGWPSVTDSEVNKIRFLDGKWCVSLLHIDRTNLGPWWWCDRRKSTWPHTDQTRAIGSRSDLKKANRRLWGAH